MKKSLIKVASSALLATTLLSTLAVAGTASANTWTARRPQEIKINKTQKEYTIQWGDTLWAISQKTNITISKLAQINDISNVNYIITGNKLTLSWDSNGNATATVVDQQGTIQSVAPITNQDKVDPSKSVGSTVTSDQVASTQDKTPSTNTVNTGSTQDNAASNTVNTDSNAGNTSSNSGNTSSNPSNTGSNTGDNGDNSGNTGSNAGNNGSNSGNNGGSVTPPVVNQKVLGVPFVNQGSTMLCEGSSLLEALQYKGYTNEGLYTFVNSMPLATNNNPYTGFAGEWRHNVDGTYQGMMAAPVIKWANAHGANATDISGQGIEGVKNSIRKGNPVVTWITYGYESPEFKQMSWGRAVWNGHVVNVDGFNNNTHQIHVIDPVFGARWINEATFTNSFNTTGMAVSVG